MNPWLILTALVVVVAVVLICRAVRPGYRTRARAEVFCMECGSHSPVLPATTTTNNLGGTA